ncbi:glutathione-dependent formaldehyde-activating GFA [Biscogniauxia mediterranea]|nr:glutathione-dependent formaldehyde-activating GFA [Biscogniauxia mediterranea]
MSKPATGDFPKPTTITGGCLCGSIRYRVDFPEDHDFMQSSGSCQCTQCRRSTGTLVFVAHTVPLRCLTYVTPVDTLNNYAATPGFQRGFCASCGSFLYWRDESRDDLALAVGCVDEEVLVGGRRDDGSEGFGFALANLRGDHMWCENEIKGVTDRMVGPGCGVKWARDRDGVRM